MNLGLDKLLVDTDLVERQAQRETRAHIFQSLGADRVLRPRANGKVAEQVIAKSSTKKAKQKTKLSNLCEMVEELFVSPKEAFEEAKAHDYIDHHMIIT